MIALIALIYALVFSYFSSLVICRLCITRKYYNFFFAAVLYVASGFSSFLLGFLFCPLFVWHFWRNKIVFLKIPFIVSICIMCFGFCNGNAQLSQSFSLEIIGKVLGITVD